MAITTKHYAISVGSGAAAQIIAPNGNRVAIWIQSYGLPDYGANPTMWLAFGQTAAAGGCWQISAGGIYTFGASDSFMGGYKSAATVCPTDYVSFIAESGTALGNIIEMSEQ